MNSSKFFPEEKLGLQFRDKYLDGFEGKTVGMLSRFDLIKGHVDFLHLSALLSESFPEVRFVIVGNHSKKNLKVLSQLLKKLGISKNISIINEIEDPIFALNGIDVLVSTSKSEGFPNVVLEAIACDTPVVATDVGDTKQIMGGFCPVFKLGDLQGMSNAIVERLDSNFSTDPELRSYATNQFSVEKLVSNTDVLLKALSKNFPKENLI